MTAAISVLGIGGTLRPGSSSEQALRIALSAAAQRGAATELLTARDLHFPMYDPGTGPVAAAQRFIDAVRRADGLIIATPGYHGGTSGLLKNALDYLQELAGDPALPGRQGSRLPGDGFRLAGRGHDPDVAAGNRALAARLANPARGRDQLVGPSLRTRRHCRRREGRRSADNPGRPGLVLRPRPAGGGIVTTGS
jgi:hypothetical protein